MTPSRLIVDCGSGATRTEPAPTRPEPALSPPDPLAILTALPPAQAEALVRLGVGLASDAGALWDALEQIAPTNTARPSIDIITHHAVEAGLALTEPGEPE